MNRAAPNYWIRAVWTVLSVAVGGIGFTEWSLHGGKQTLSVLLPALILVSSIISAVLQLREVKESKSRKPAIAMFCFGAVFMGAFVQLLRALLLP